LKAVDGTDILHMEVDEKTCEHTAGDLLLGEQGSMCELLLFRVENSQDLPMLADKVKLFEVSVSVPRVLRHWCPVCEGLEQLRVDSPETRHNGREQPENPT
jgi:hypothetical protein